MLGYFWELGAGSNAQNSPGQRLCKREREEEISIPFEQGFVHYIISYFIKYMHSRKAGFFSGALGTAIRKPEILGCNKILRCNKIRHLKKAIVPLFTVA